jgi:hypothetical protein
MQLCLTIDNLPLRRVSERGGDLDLAHEAADAQAGGKLGTEDVQ